MELLADLREKYTDAIQVDADHMTTGQWIETWLNLYIVPKVSASTFNLYYGLMHKYAIPRIGHILLSKLTELDIQAVIYGPLRNKYRSACMFRILMMALLKKAVKARLINSSHFDLKDIQAQLGHASIKITMDIYTHLDEETQQNKVGQWLEENLTNLLDNPASKQHQL